MIKINKIFKKSNKKLFAGVYMSLVLILTVFQLNLISEEKKPSINPGLGTYKIVSKNKKVEIPFELYRGDIRMNAVINGKKVKMLLDNGTLWDQLLFFGSPKVDALNLKYNKNKISVGGGGEGNSIKSKTSSGVTIEFPGIIFYDQEAIITPYTPGRPNPWGDCEGQVSANFLKQFVVDINFDRMILSLIKPSDFIAKKNIGAELPMIAIKPGSWGIPVEITDTNDKKFHQTLMMDLGYPSALKLISGLKNGINLPLKKVTRIGFGMIGPEKIFLGRIKGIKIAKYNIPNVLSTFKMSQNNSKRKQFSMIGMELFSRFNLIFNYPAKKLNIIPNKNFNNPMKHNMAGLQIIPTGGKFSIIFEVDNNSPASEAKLAKGDKIYKLNGISIVDYDRKHLHSIFRKENSKIELEIQRKNKKNKETLILKLRKII